MIPPSLDGGAPCRDSEREMLVVGLLMMGDIVVMLELHDLGGILLSEALILVESVWNAS